MSFKREQNNRKKEKIKKEKQKNIRLRKSMFNVLNKIVKEVVASNHEKMQGRYD